ncbi:MAG: hypothetical protein HC900_03340 [Methylacidiphilales bacterium]|nr:hypothetical protein [Candidatus Methylacidiphilales bacterium]
MSANEPTVSHREVKRGSERSFGVVFAVAFAVIGLLPIVTRGDGARWWALAVAVAFAAVAILAPALLGPLNRAWFKFGLLLHHLVNPLIMGLLFYGAFVPMALVLRASGRDLLRLKRESAAESYWILRDPPGPETGSMSKQF